MMQTKTTYRDFIYGSITGINKKENQDNLFVAQEPNYCIYSIFDGVGSAINSKQATEIAIDYLKDNYKRYLKDVVQLDRLMFECNNYLLSKSVNEALTTYCVAFIPLDRNSHAIYSSLGDSRIYLIHRQYVQQLTKDDKHGYGRNVISKCLGMDLSIENFQQREIVLGESSLLLCTDGFYNLFEENKLKYFEAFQNSDLKNSKKELVSYLDGSNLDDATFIFIR